MNDLIVISQECSVPKQLRSRRDWDRAKKAARQVQSTAASGYNAVTSAVGKGKKAVADAKQSVDDRVSKLVGLEFEWCDAALTFVPIGGAASAVLGRHRLRAWAETHFHDCGHFRVFKDINDAIDSVSGRNHRIADGHSIECLPGLVKQFGWIAVPAYVLHLAQDLTTKDGIPVVPFPSVVKTALEKYGVPATKATACVTTNLARVIRGVGTTFVVIEVAWLGYRLYVAVQEKRSTAGGPGVTPKGKEGGLCVAAA
jgi:hypothetical protein